MEIYIASWLVALRRLSWKLSTVRHIWRYMEIYIHTQLASSIAQTHLKVVDCQDAHSAVHADLYG